MNMQKCNMCVLMRLLTAMDDDKLSEKVTLCMRREYMLCGYFFNRICLLRQRPCQRFGWPSFVSKNYFRGNHVTPSSRRHLWITSIV